MGLTMLTGLPRAEAASCSTEYGLAAFEDVSTPQFDDSRATASDMWVNGVPKACQWVSSIYVLSNQGGFEFGYVMGDMYCHGTHFFLTHPTLFYYAKYASGSLAGCGTLPGTVTSGNFYKFRASDLDANYQWGGWLNGAELQPAGVGLDFNHGASYVARERRAGDPSGYAQWKNLQEWHAANHWSYWDDADCLSEDDPTYYCHRLAANRVAAELS